MPPRWPRQPDRKNDPAFRRLDDRMNFTIPHNFSAQILDIRLSFEQAPKF